MPKPGDVVAGKYLVDQLLGEGGMGAVFAATHRFTGKQVALKWMLPELARDEDAVQRFMREANAAGRISHPNVVDVYDVGQHDDSFFLVMEHLRGEPLTTALARQDMTVREVLELLLRAMRGVAAAHRQGVVHRDLKPDNIFIAYEEDGVRREPKVLDFGISKVAGAEGQINPRLTRTGAVVGTPYYMSPEQIRGSDNLDKRADIYSFGVILYESLTGQVPFTAETYGALVLEIATGTPRPPRDLVPGLPHDLSLVVLKSMARNAADRYPDMESLIHALEPFLQSETAVRENSGSQPRMPTPANSRRISSTSAVSTPFFAEPPVDEPPPRLRRGGGNTFLVIGAAAVVVFMIWLAITRLRTPDMPLASPTPPAAAAPGTAPPPPAAVNVPSTPLPSGASAAPPAPANRAGLSPSEAAPAAIQPVETSPAPSAVAPLAPSTQPSATTPRWKPRKRPEDFEEAYPPPPAPVVTPTPVPAAPSVVAPSPAAPPQVQVKPAPARRARSGTLSVDEF